MDKLYFTLPVSYSTRTASLNLSKSSLIKILPRFIMIEGNRPMLRAKGLKKKAIKWTVKGEVKYQSNVNQAIKQIEDYLEPKPVKK